MRREYPEQRRARVKRERRKRQWQYGADPMRNLLNDMAEVLATK